MNKKFPLLSKAEQADLSKSILFFNMQELRRMCEGLQLPSKGKKMALITRIMTFIETGKIVLEQEIPAISRIKEGQKIPLESQAKILFGSFKNDAATRAFFKKLIGEHFHYTAFGVDWISERWFAGNPPTYKEFAIFWQQEYEARKKTKIPPKKEWALLNFVAAYLKKFPTAEREEVVTAWKQERAQQVERGMVLLRKIL